MKLKDFFQLDETEKGEAVWEHGTLLGDYKEAPFRFILYQVAGFYVELRYHMEHNVLRGMRAFDNTEDLVPYLEQIQLQKPLGALRATIAELRTKALELLPPETINGIMDQKQDGLVTLNYSIGLYLRNHLNLWHTQVYDQQGGKLHPDDATLEIIKEIWELGR